MQIPEPKFHKGQKVLYQGYIFCEIEGPEKYDMIEGWSYRITGSENGPFLERSLSASIDEAITSMEEKLAQLYANAQSSIDAYARALARYAEVHEYLRSFKI